ncbi:MAG TPA: polysaccharide deacetylase family protein [Candidatus Angelobacter sp.]|nr:polysaccharide deacetylase family protein [Candidatus Angelobacter sp.]
MGKRLFTRSTIRARGKLLWAGVLRFSGVLRLARRWVRNRGTIVLTFHRVLPDDELRSTASLPGMVVREKTFDDFLRYAAQSCQFADLAHEPDWSPSPKLKLAVTFDDGWSDSATNTAPIAGKHRVPLLIFIVPEKMGTTLPFWPERAASVLEQRLAGARGAGANYIERAIENLKELPAEERNQRVGQMVAEHPAAEPVPDVDRTMTWEQARALDRQGVRLGSHTSTHEILTAITLSQAEQEIFGSRDRIEHELAKPCEFFSYPNGDCSGEVRDLAERAGYRLAFLNQDPGVWTRDCDPYLIPRVNVCEYHLVNAKGEFSPLIFEYAVIWKAAKGLMRESWRKIAGMARSMDESGKGLPRQQGPTTKNRKQRAGLSS